VLHATVSVYRGTKPLRAINRCFAVAINSDKYSNNSVGHKIIAKRFYEYCPSNFKRTRIPSKKRGVSAADGVCNDSSRMSQI
jgi:hypothetical protein